MIVLKSNVSPYAKVLVIVLVPVLVHPVSDTEVTPFPDSIVIGYEFIVKLATNVTSLVLLSAKSLK